MHMREADNTKWRRGSRGKFKKKSLHPPGWRARDGKEQTRPGRMGHVVKYLMKM